MSYRSINPANGETLQTYKETTDEELEAALQAAATCFESWRDQPFAERAVIANRAAEILRSQLDEYARLVTLEMGKRFEEAQGEVELSADIIAYYAAVELSILSTGSFRCTQSDGGQCCDGETFGHRSAVRPCF